MEPSGRNQWQPVANGRAPKTGEPSQNRCRGLRPVDGKEGVDGSSPSEGFTKVPANAELLFAQWTVERALDVHQTSTAQRND
jgi:hypothetical protein